MSSCGQIPKERGSVMWVVVRRNRVAGGRRRGRGLWG